MAIVMAQIPQIFTFCLAISALNAITLHREPTVWPTLSGKPPHFYGHGGEKFYLPEHTTGSYRLAAIEGADYVEPDIVLTKDRIPICFHDIALKRSTNVEEFPEFANRRGNHSVIIDGKNSTIVDDYLVIHFTLEELKRLRVVQQPNGVRLQDFNNLYPISTFQEFLVSVAEVGYNLGNVGIGLIPELKHPQFHNTIFHEVPHFMESLLLQVLRNNGYPLQSWEGEGNCTFAGVRIQCGPIILQNFDHNTVRYLSTVVSHPNVELMTLIHPNVYLLTPSGFSEIANYSHYICLWKEYMYTGVEAEIAFKGWEYEPDVVERLGGFYSPQEFVLEGHKLGIKMTLFTIPDSRESSGRGCARACEDVDKEAEMFYFFDMGIDGLFVENIPESQIIRMKYDYELKLANLTSYK